MPTGFVAAAERVNVAADGSEADQPATGNWNSLSDDGRFAVFSSAAANLVAGDSNGVADVFVRDRQTGTTSRVSMASNGSEADGPSGAAVISGNGRYVAFESQAGNLVAGDSNGVSDIFIHDRQTGQTWRVSVAGDGSQGNGPSQRPDLSADGRFVSFESQATNLVPGAPYWGGIYVH
ncbi:MAG: TolB family protein, partial [Gammaproteobacteria bacterium]